MKKINYNIILILLALIIFYSMWRYDTEDFFRYKSHAEDYDVIEVEITDIATGLNHRRLKFQYNMDGIIMSGTIRGHLWDNIGDKVMVAVKKSEPYVYTRTDICIFPTMIGVYIFLIGIVIEGVVNLLKNK